MSNQPDQTEPKQVRFGFTATGSSVHVIDDWGNNRAQKSMCNIVVRDWDEMVKQFGLEEDEATGLLRLDWCGKCDKWLKRMRYLNSMGVPTEVPEWVIKTLSIEFGYANENLAEVINFLEWKEAKGYA